MATIDWPTGNSFKPARMAFGASTPKSAWGGFFTGQQQSISHLADRLRMELTLPPCTYAESGPREALLMHLASSGDWVRLGHFLRPQPVGTLRGSPLVQAAAAAGARTVRIHKAASTTNLLLSSQALESTGEWGRFSSLAVTANTHAAPNSALVTADTITDSNAAAAGALQQTRTVANDGTTYVASVYVRKTTGGTAPTFVMTLGFVGGTGINTSPFINTDLGTVLLGSATVTPTADGLYWRVSSAVSNNSSGNTTLYVNLYPSYAPYGSTTLNVATTGSAVVWGAQVEVGSAATAFNPPTLIGGDILSIFGQLCPVGYLGAADTGLNYIDVPLALPLRRALIGGETVTWDRPTGDFQLLGDLSSVQYMPGRFQDAITLQFVEAY